MHEFAQFLFEKGELHDCKIRSFSWSPESNQAELSIVDLNANFIGLPEYSGPQPGSLAFEGVEFIEINLEHAAGTLTIYESRFESQDGVLSVAFLVSPAGKIRMRFTSVIVQT